MRTDDVAGPSESAQLVVALAVDVLQSVGALRGVFPDLPALELKSTPLDEIGFAFELGDTIDGWFAAARKSNADVDAMLRYVGR
jgi:hypothetical protein